MSWPLSVAPWKKNTEPTILRPCRCVAFLLARLHLHSCPSHRFVVSPWWILCDIFDLCRVAWCLYEKESSRTSDILDTHVEGMIHPNDGCARRGWLWRANDEFGIVLDGVREMAFHSPIERSQGRSYRTTYVCMRISISSMLLSRGTRRIKLHDSPPKLGALPVW